jgi:apolipoprotein N-acyltransferase
VATTLPSATPATSGAGRASLFPSIALALLSAVLLNFCFPVAGPLPPWRAVLSWFALVPLLYALLAEKNVAHPRYLRRSAIAGWFFGLLFYILNCYWIYQTMLIYGGVPPFGSAGILFLFSAGLGFYGALFGFLTAWFRRRFGLSAALALAPFAWAAIDLLASRFTSVPWDQLGYAQVDNLGLTRLAPVTGVYGITVVLVLGNALIAAAILSYVSRVPHVRIPGRGPQRSKTARLFLQAFAFVVILQFSRWLPSPAAPTQATAVLLQENLTVHQDNSWPDQAWDEKTHSFLHPWNENIARFLRASEQSCTPYFTGLPQPETVTPSPACTATPISLVAWPEAPSPFRGWDPRFTSAMATLAQTTHATIVAGNISADQGTDENGQPTEDDYNSASVFSPAGPLIGRYDKIHLVPYGEFIPYRNLFSFAKHLTQNVSDFSRGKERKVFPIGENAAGNRGENSHRFGIFICYESVFADEIRHFAANGAGVLVNISDDAWYGDTSAPWQHLNMARMRAIENRRWILRDTNDGVTAAVDPYGRITQSVPRHIFTSLAVRYGYRSDITFYSRYGDVFALLCALIVLAAAAAAYRSAKKPPIQA